VWRNYFAAALRNLLRNRAYATINICGLALGFAAVLLLALFVRDEYSFDRFFPDHERVYRVMETFQLPGQARVRVAVTAANIAVAMKLDFPEVEAVTRLSYAGVALREGDIEAPTTAYWLAVRAAGSVGQPDRVAVGLRFHAALAGWLCLSRQLEPADLCGGERARARHCVVDSVGARGARSSG
jgi:hypothetical protein